MKFWITNQKCVFEHERPIIINIIIIVIIIIIQ